MSTEDINTNISIYNKFKYSEEDRLNYYVDNKGRTALCFTCAYDGHCQYPMRYTKCRHYIKINRNE